MDKTTSHKNPRHEAAQAYTEDQARLLLAMRDMVKWEVQRQLAELLESKS